MLNPSEEATGCLLCDTDNDSLPAALTTDNTDFEDHPHNAGNDGTSEVNRLYLLPRASRAQHRDDLMSVDCAKLNYAR